MQGAGLRLSPQQNQRPGPTWLLCCELLLRVSSPCPTGALATVRLYLRQAHGLRWSSADTVTRIVNRGPGTAPSLSSGLSAKVPQPEAQWPLLDLTEVTKPSLLPSAHHCLIYVKRGQEIPETVPSEKFFLAQEGEGCVHTSPPPKKNKHFASQARGTREHHSGGAGLPEGSLAPHPHLHLPALHSG